MYRIYLSKGNAKLKKTAKVRNAAVMAFDLPAGYTCPYAGECRKYCYAKKGRYVFESKRNCNDGNYHASLELDFVPRMVAILKGEDAKTDKKIHIRIHSSGDFYNREYALKWESIARECPEIVFYAYTKSVEIVKSIDWPENVHIAYSIGGTQDDLIPPESTIAKIFDTPEDAINNGYDPAIMQDDLLVVYGSKRLGLIKH